MNKNLLFGIKKENNVITLTRKCLVEDAFKLNVTKGDILYFEDEGKKELIENTVKTMIIAHGLKEKWNTEVVAEILYFAGDDFDTISDYWYAKDTDPSIYQKLKEINK